MFRVTANVLDPNEISGYEIVRVHRTINDMATVAQGIIASTVEKKDDNNVTLN
jgi:hypothetical protein